MRFGKYPEFLSAYLSKEKAEFWTQAAIDLNKKSIAAWYQIAQDFNKKKQSIITPKPQSASVLGQGIEQRRRFIH